jgi:hypothetical protein
MASQKFSVEELRFAVAYRPISAVIFHESDHDILTSHADGAQLLGDCPVEKLLTLGRPAANQRDLDEDDVATFYAEIALIEDEVSIPTSLDDLESVGVWDSDGRHQRLVNTISDTPLYIC